MLAFQHISRWKAVELSFFHFGCYSIRVYLIGYGHISPITTVGRIFTMIITVIGLPLMVLTVGVLANLLVHIVLFLIDLSGIRCHIKRRSEGNHQAKYSYTDSISELGVTEIQNSKSQMTCKRIFIVSIILTIHLFVASLLFSQIESWAFFNSFYFIFITFATIGIF